MQKKFLLGTLLAGAFALVLGAGAMIVTAQGPTNTYPGGAVGMDNQFHFIPANARLWYFFEYAGDRSPIELVLLEGTINRLDFNLYLPTQVTLPDQFADKPIGRGTSPALPCPSGAANCAANNKVWLGNFTLPGIFYVQVINNNPQGVSFLLQVTGSGIALHPPTATPALPIATRRPAVATATPYAVLTSMAIFVATMQGPGPTVATPTLVASAAVTPTATLTPTAFSAATETPAGPQNLYYTSAEYVSDNRVRMIPDHTDLWFRFDYAGDRSKISVTVTDGYLNGLKFKLYTPDQIAGYDAKTKPAGEGMASWIACDMGKCYSNELTWNGAFPINGTYYVQVSNETSKAAGFQLIVKGEGNSVVLGH